MSEVRVTNDDDPKIEGHAAVFNQLSEPLGGFRERIAPGAFAKSLKGDVKALWNHNSDYVLGRTKSGTLQLKEDEKGLFVRISPPSASFAADAMEMIRRGDVDQMSFGFSALQDDMVIENGENIRTVFEAALFDVSPVAFPAYPQTDVALRSIFGEAEEDGEKILQALVRVRYGLKLEDEDCNALNSLGGKIRSVLQNKTAPNESLQVSFDTSALEELSTRFEDAVGGLVRRLSILERRVKLLDT